VEILERFQWKSERITSGLEHLTYGERLRKLGLFGLMKRKLRHNLIATRNYLNST